MRKIETLDLNMGIQCRDPELGRDGFECQDVNRKAFASQRVREVDGRAFGAADAEAAGYDDDSAALSHTVRITRRVRCRRLVLADSARIPS